MNCSFFKFIITKKQYIYIYIYIYIYYLDVSFDFSAFKVNLIISLCNQSIKRPKTLVPQLFFAFKGYASHFTMHLKYERNNLSSINMIIINEPN
jgi:hypothetical protein